MNHNTKAQTKAVQTAQFAYCENAWPNSLTHAAVAARTSTEPSCNLDVRPIIMALEAALAAADLPAELAKHRYYAYEARCFCGARPRVDRVGWNEGYLWYADHLAKIVRKAIVFTP